MDHTDRPDLNDTSKDGDGRDPLTTRLVDEEEGSLVTEYGLLAVVAATICGVVIQWASGGAIVRLFNSLINGARDLVIG